MTDTSTRDGDSAETIAAALRAEIIRGDLPPGGLLRQEELARRFRVSRMPVREGLRLLEHEGLVQLPPNRSARVAPLDPDSFREINEMRAVAEPLALRHAIPELTDRQLDRAAAIQAEAESGGAEEFSRLNREFHAALLAPCGRPRLLRHIATLNDLSERYFNVAAQQLNYAARSHEEHRALLAACRKRDVETASALLEAHISQASALLLEAMGASGV